MPCCLGHAADPKAPDPWTNTTRCLNMPQPYGKLRRQELLAPAKELVEALGQVELGRIEVRALLAEGGTGGKRLAGAGTAALSIAELLRSLGRVSGLGLLLGRVFG